MNKNIENLKETLYNSTQRYNILFQWIKNDKITYNQFKELLKYIDGLKLKDLSYDSLS